MLEDVDRGHRYGRLHKNINQSAELKEISNSCEIYVRIINDF